MDLIIIFGLGALLLFFMFSSRRKQKARVENLKNNLAPGAEVMTTFGVYGTVLTISPEDNVVTIESGPGTVLRIHQQAIGHIEPTAGVATDGLGEDAGTAERPASDPLTAEDRLDDRNRLDDRDPLDRDPLDRDRLDDRDPLDRDTLGGEPRATDPLDDRDRLDRDPFEEDRDRRDERGDEPKA